MKRILLLLAMPWVATPTLGRILAIVILALQLLAAIVAAATAPVHGAWHLPPTAILLLGYAIWLWSAMLSANLQLARNARELRLPRIAGDANSSVLALWCIGVVLPSLVCAAMGAPWFATSVFFVFAAAVGLAYTLLPFYLGLPLTIAVFFLALLHGPTATSAAWTPVVWMGLSACALGIVGWRWWRLQRAGTIATEGWNTAIVFYCYRQDVMLNGGWPNLSRMFLQRRIEKPGHVDFHRIGPDRPTASLRLALGGLGMPKSPAARLRDAMVLLVYVLLIGLVLVVPATIPDAHEYLRSAATFRLHWIPPLMIYLGALMCCYGVSLFAGRVRALWRKQDAELAMLALLPGLGDAAACKRHALCAALAPPAIFLTIAMLVLWVGAVAVAAKPWAFLAVALCCGGAFMLASAVTLTSLGGKSIHLAGYAILYLGVLGFTLWTLIAGLPTDQYHGAQPETIGVLPVWLLLCWAGFLILLGGMAYAGWRGLRRQPHVFLANAR